MNNYLGCKIIHNITMAAQIHKLLLPIMNSLGRTSNRLSRNTNGPLMKSIETISP